MNTSASDLININPYPAGDVFLPLQLQRGDLLFVLIPRGEKRPLIPGWNQVRNGIKSFDPRLISHLKSGGNCGFYPSPASNILNIDVDNADLFHLAGGAELIENTFKYSAWPDRHKYRAIVECPDMPLEWRGHKTSITREDKSTIFELFFPASFEKAGGQCVAPGSLHPNGYRYEPFDPDAPIHVVKWADIWQVVQILSPATIPPTIPEMVTRTRSPGSGLTLTDRYGLSVCDHYPDNPRICGDEVRGSHPIHGSTTGENVAVNPTKGIFYCFRCNRGGDAAIWDAINRGIIQCDEPYDDAAFRKHVEILNHERPEVRALERAAWRKQQQAGGKR